MIVLEEQIDIAAPFEKLCQWADHFEEEFVKWSPYHLECQLLDGGINTGDRVRFREIVMGIDYDVTGKIIHAEKDAQHFLFRFESDQKTALITFGGQRTADGCRFSHSEAFGSQMPLLGPLINFLIFSVFYRKKANWKRIRDDMILDNQYLNMILTTGRYPQRIPMEQLEKQP